LKEDKISLFNNNIFISHLVQIAWPRSIATYKSITVDNLAKKLGGTSTSERGGSDGLSVSEGDQYRH